MSKKFELAEGALDTPHVRSLMARALGVSQNGEGVRNEIPAYLRGENKKEKLFSVMKLISQQVMGFSQVGFDARGNKRREAIIKAFSQSPAGHLFANNPGPHLGGLLVAMVDMPLTDVSNGYFNDMFIGDQVLTPNPVLVQTGDVWEYGEEHLRGRNPADYQVDGHGDVESTDTNSRDILGSYHVRTYGLKGSVTPNDLMNVLLPFDAEADLTRAITQILMLMCEIDIADKIMTAGNFPATNNAAITNGRAINQAASTAADLETPINSIRSSVRLACGRYPNTMICDEDVVEKLIRHPLIRGQIWQDLTSSRTATETEIMRAFQVNRLLVGKALKLGNNGLDPVWGKNIFLGYIEGSKALRQRTLGYFSHYNSMNGYTLTRPSVGNPINREIFQYKNWEHKIFNNTCGGLMTNVLA